MNRYVSALGLRAPRHAEYFHWHEEQATNGFTVQTVYSGISVGTESTLIAGTHPAHHHGWNRELGLFTAQHEQRIYPITRLGYMEVGRVSSSGLTEVHVGDLLCMAYGHRTSYFGTSTDFFQPLPSSIEPILGVYVSTLGCVAANALLHSAVAEIGPNVLDLSAGVAEKKIVVLGAGAVGLLVIAFARYFGAYEVVAVEQKQNRREAAIALGATVSAAPDDKLATFWKTKWFRSTGDAGADIVFQTRPSAKSLALALKIARRRGVIVDLSFYTDTADEVSLGHEFHHNGLTILSAQVDNLPRGTEKLWSRSKLAEITLRVLERYGDALKRHCLTRLTPFERGSELLTDIAESRVRDITPVLSFSAEL
jgi:NADPH:quinone reductase-like Zn-dependent oxidoreductase